MRFKIFFGTLFLLVLNTITLYAQPGEPCAGTDPDAMCPLDSWVIVLAAAAFVFATVHLYRKRSPQKTKFSR
jgi:hypothetical protein